MARNFILNFPLSIVMGAALLVSACGGGSDSSDVNNSNPLVVDSAFGDAGSVRIALAPYNGSVDSVVEQADGKLIVAGYRKLASSSVPEYAYGVRPQSILFVKRYLENGQLDASFGAAGSVEFSVRGADQMPSVTPMEDGAMYVSVNASKPCHYALGNRRLICFDGQVEEPGRTAWVGLSSTGVVDGGVPGEGLNIAQLPEKIRALSIPGVGQKLDLSDGKYLIFHTYGATVAGLYSSNLTRYLSGGVVDTSFGNNGVVKSRCVAYAGGVVMDKQKNIWTIGAQDVVDAGICIEKLTENGATSLDVPAPIKTILGTNVTINDTKIAGDGTLMVAVVANDTDKYELKTLKYQMDGTLASDYGAQGIVSLKGLTADQVFGMRLHIEASTGSIAGVRDGYRYSPNSDNRPNIWAKWLSNGSLDKRFGSGGLLTMGDMPDFSQRRATLVDGQKRWLMQTDTSAGIGVDSAGVVTLTRFVGDSQ